MKKIIYVLIFILFNTSYAQKELITTSGIIHFEASVPLFEEVEASNKKVSCILNLENGQITTVVHMKEFHFKLSLMEEHFNKKYLETDNYPHASFKGTIVGFNLNIIDTNPKQFNMKGDLKIHGKTKKINTVVILRKLENKLEIISNFSIKIKDFNIKIPEMLSMKIAQTVTIKSEFLLQ